MSAAAAAVLARNAHKMTGARAQHVPATQRITPSPEVRSFPNQPTDIDMQIEESTVASDDDQNEIHAEDPDEDLEVAATNAMAARYSEDMSNLETRLTDRIDQSGRDISERLDLFQGTIASALEAVRVETRDNISVVKNIELHNLRTMSAVTQNLNDQTNYSHGVNQTIRDISNRLESLERECSRSSNELTQRLELIMRSLDTMENRNMQRQSDLLAHIATRTTGIPTNRIMTRSRSIVMEL